MNPLNKILDGILRLRFGPKRFPITCSFCNHKGLSRIAPDWKNRFVSIHCTNCGRDGIVTLDSKGVMY